MYNDLIESNVWLLLPLLRWWHFTSLFFHWCPIIYTAVTLTLFQPHYTTLEFSRVQLWVHSCFSYISLGSIIISYRIAFFLITNDTKWYFSFRWMILVCLCDISSWIDKLNLNKTNLLIAFQTILWILILSSLDQLDQSPDLLDFLSTSLFKNKVSWLQKLQKFSYKLI